MDIERNKAVAREFFDALNRADGKAVLALYAEDAVCWTAGSLPFSGSHGVAEIAVIMVGILSAFPQGIQLSIKGMTAEGARDRKSTRLNSSH